MEVLERYKESLKLLKENEEYYQQLTGENGLISICDQKLDYWEHYIEFNKVELKQLYRIYKEMKRLRMLRRKYKNDKELIKIFKDNEQKMQNPSNREILLVQLCKTDNKQQNAKYGYTAYTEEEKNQILGIEVIETNEIIKG